MQGLWVYVRFKALQLGTIVNSNGSAAQHTVNPIAIYDALNNQLCQLNPAALNQGLKIGMGLAAASALCAELTIIEYDADKEIQQLLSITQQLYGVTADISLDKPDGLYLRIDNMLRLYADIDSYWHTIQTLLSEFHYDYASAYSISAAKVLARARYNRISLEQRNWQQALRRCRLSHSALTDKQVSALQRVGISSFDDLFTQPLSAIAARFDGPMLRYLSELKGERFEQLTLYRPAQQFIRYSELLYEITLAERLLKPLEHLLKMLERYLIQRALVTFDLTVELHLRDKQQQQWQLHSAQGENRTQAWLTIAGVSVERLTLEAPVQGLTLKAQQLSHVVAANDDLFAGKQTQMTTLQLISRLQAKMGKQGVYQLQMAHDHRPEQLNVVVYPADGQWSASQKAPPVFSDRPSLLLKEPIPLTQASKVLTPPERIIAGWWSDSPCERDYFIAQNDDGQYLWVFRDHHKQWYIHGYFA